MAAPCLHATNLPKREDLALAVKAVQNARARKLGFWADADKILHGYEFRALVRLGNGEPGFDYRLRDLREMTGSRGRERRPVEYIAIPAEYRVFV